ncbi:hypothetical protein [Acinetobacter pollinis]|uniref:hypothetical protein n=1 Tax=Acinetobacter pollinis TaxID=2605270 RepID=UPI0018A2B80A|nr:hypothetical protein [Acinetobacter pollinis]MBF7689306.1 hypothetical protein [Acinetobacter pollinis]MBF7691969.1 hypothetical protein [Acinetobacter pollinis]MBF7696851.1 hypothetical protein [Acinetobacter pollinis]MBF7700074.1 hypothetical protein [Acinetobacter pollinis]
MELSKTFIAVGGLIVAGLVWGNNLYFHYSMESGYRDSLKAIPSTKINKTFHDNLVGQVERKMGYPEIFFNIGLDHLNDDFFPKTLHDELEKMLCDFTQLPLGLNIENKRVMKSRLTVIEKDKVTVHLNVYNQYKEVLFKETKVLKGCSEFQALKKKYQ